MKIDLHMHTRYSDGGKTRIELIDLCRENKIDLISITDHNNFLVDDIKYDDIKIMRGMEVDTRYKDKTFHMLIYNFDLNSKELKKYKRNNRRYDIKNFREIVKQLEISFAKGIECSKTKEINPEAYEGIKNMAFAGIEKRYGININNPEVIQGINK